MILQQENNRLHFAPTGKHLFHSHKKQVSVYDVERGEKLYQHAGQWIGQSHSGETFLTCVDSAEFRCYATQSGEQIALSSVDVATYPAHHRFVVYGFPWPYEKKNPAPLQIVDAFGIEPPQTLQLPRQDGDWPEAWAMVPNQRQVAVTHYALDGHLEWAYGYFVDLESGALLMDEGKAKTFSVPKHSKPRLRFSAEHNLLTTGSNGKFDVFDLETGSKRQTVSLMGTNAMLFTLDPKDSWRAATNFVPYATSYRSQDETYYIALFDLRQNDRFATPYDTIPEHNALNGLAFHPKEPLIACALTGNRGIHLWNVETKQKVIVWEM